MHRTANKNKKFIFLDIDGVLNGWNRLTDVYMWMLSHNKLFRKLFEKIDIYGIETIRVFYLWIICKVTGAKVVLSSSWRDKYKIPYDKCSGRVKELKRKFRFFHIPVVSLTPHLSGSCREQEVAMWLHDHHVYNVDTRFAIIDDEDFGFNTAFPDNFVKTCNLSEYDILHGVRKNEISGLSLKHVLRAIKILNR